MAEPEVGQGETAPSLGSFHVLGGSTILRFDDGEAKAT